MDAARTKIAVRTLTGDVLAFRNVCDGGMFSYEELRPYSRTPFDATHIPEPSEKDGAGMSEAQSVASERFRGRDVQSELIPFFQVGNAFR